MFSGAKLLATLNPHRHPKTTKLSGEEGLRAGESGVFEPGGRWYRNFPRTAKTQGTEICNFRVPSRLDFRFSSSGLFPVSPGCLCNIVRKSPHIRRKFARFPGGEKKRRSLSRLWLSRFFRSRCKDCHFLS